MKEENTEEKEEQAAEEELPGKVVVAEHIKARFACALSMMEACCGAAQAIGVRVAARIGGNPLDATALAITLYRSVMQEEVRIQETTTILTSEGDVPPGFPGKVAIKHPGGREILRGSGEHPNVVEQANCSHVSLVALSKFYNFWRRTYTEKAEVANTLILNFYELPTDGRSLEYDGQAFIRCLQCGTLIDSQIVTSGKIAEVFSSITTP